MFWKKRTLEFGSSQVKLFSTPQHEHCVDHLFLCFFKKYICIFSSFGGKLVILVADWPSCCFTLATQWYRMFLQCWCMLQGKKLSLSFPGALSLLHLVNMTTVIRWILQFLHSSFSISLIHLDLKYKCY